MRAVLPQHTRIEKEAREDMALFAVGYIQLLTSKGLSTPFLLLNHPHKNGRANTSL